MRQLLPMRLLPLRLSSHPVQAGTCGGARTVEARHPTLQPDVATRHAGAVCAWKGWSRRRPRVREKMCVPATSWEQGAKLHAWTGRTPASRNWKQRRQRRQPPAFAAAAGSAPTLVTAARSWPSLCVTSKGEVRSSPESDVSSGGENTPRPEERILGNT